jgi:hypothetical protein
MPHKLRRLAVLIALTTGFPASAEAARNRCGLGQVPVQSTKRLHISLEHRVTSDVWVACWKSTGVRRVIVRFPNEPRSPLVSFAARRRWVAWQYFVGDSGLRSEDTGHMGSLNVKTGRRGPTVTSRTGIAGPTNGPVAETAGDNDDLIVAIASNGWYAWTTPGQESEGGPRIHALYVSDGEGGSVRLDTGGITYLAARGEFITWRNGGVRKRAHIGP